MFLTNSKKTEILNQIIKDKNIEIKQLHYVIDKYFIELMNTKRELYELKKNNKKLNFEYNRTTTKAKRKKND